jgi:hypothetical protein
MSFKLSYSLKGFINSFNINEELRINILLILNKLKY